MMSNKNKLLMSLSCWAQPVKSKSSRISLVS